LKLKIYDRPQDAQERKKKLVEYFSMTGSAKASTVAKHIVDEFFVEGSDERKDDRKVLVFAHHQVVIDTIALEMAKRVRLSTALLLHIHIVSKFFRQATATCLMVDSI
jgi:hypothetical protein